MHIKYCTIVFKEFGLLSSHSIVDWNIFSFLPLNKLLDDILKSYRSST